MNRPRRTSRHGRREARAAATAVRSRARAAPRPLAKPTVANPLAGVPSPHVRRFRALRGDISAWQAFLLGAACIGLCGVAWWALTSGPIPEERFLGPAVLPSPYETFADFHSLWFDHALTRNTLMMVGPVRRSGRRCPADERAP